VVSASGKRVLAVHFDGALPNGGYLVVGSAAVLVLAGVMKIDFALPMDNLPNDLTLDFAWVPAGAPDSPILHGGPGYYFDSDTKEGSACMIPNGAVNLTSDSLPFCSTPTPGARNQL